MSAIDVICGVCGQRNPEHRRFCSACSRYLDASSQRVPSEDEAPAQPVVDDEQQRFEPAVTAPPDIRSEGRATEATARPQLGPAPGLSTQPCPRCGTQNRSQLRFCRKCGHFLADPSTSSYVTPPPAHAEGWWQRLKARWGQDGSNSARAAYRRSLPMRYRVIRWATVVVVVLAAVGIPLWLTHGGADWLRSLI